MKTIPKDMRHLLPVEQIITSAEREADERCRRRVLTVFALTGWVFFALALAIR